MNLNDITITKILPVRMHSSSLLLNLDTLCGDALIVVSQIFSIYDLSLINWDLFVCLYVSYRSWVSTVLLSSLYCSMIVLYTVIVSWYCTSRCSFIVLSGLLHIKFLLLLLQSVASKRLTSKY
jgi:hypothetical protein